MRLLPDDKTRIPRAYPAVIALLVGLLAALSLSSSASAATPCGKKVLGDWFDNGRIDRIYPLNCYEEAIDAIPNDIRDYANAEEVITRALQYALRDRLAPAGTGAKNGGAGGPGGTGGNSSGDSGDSGKQAAPDVNASGPSSVPIPLLVLGGLSLALLAAGGLGYVSRRRHATQADDGDDGDPLS